jgi:hypothetical protein
MDHSARDHPGTHRSPIVTPIRTQAALGSARRRALASSPASSAVMPAAACGFGRVRGQSIRWARATMIPSGPRT